MKDGDIFVEDLGNRKYYGTRVEWGDGTLTIWHMGDGEPSDRQLECWNLTRLAWDAKVTLECGDPCSELACDSHYETRDGYALAVRVAKAIAEGKI